METLRTHEFAPVYQFNEFHSISIAASKDRVYSAIRTVTPEEVRFFKTLMWIRFLHAPSGRRPITDSFLPLADDPDREIVFGGAGDGRTARKFTAEEFKAFRQSPMIKIAANFRIEEGDASHCSLTTETRVYAVGSQAVRGFATYWRMIYPGSALIRRMWLRAIKLRAESPKQGRPPGRSSSRPASNSGLPTGFAASVTPKVP